MPGRLKLLGAMVSLATVLGGIGFIWADSSDKQSADPGARLSTDDQQALVDAARTQVASPQSAFLQEFNGGRRSYAALPIGELESLSLAGSSLSSLAMEADRVVLVEAVSLFFVGSGMEDLPATRVTYKVVETLKGDADPGEHFDVTVMGGPYRQPNGVEVFIQPAGWPVDRPGEQSVLFLAASGTTPGERLSSPNGHFRVKAGKVVADGYSSQSLGGRDQTLAEFSAVLKPVR